MTLGRNLERKTGDRVAMGDGASAVWVALCWIYRARVA